MLPLWHVLCFGSFSANLRLFLWFGFGFHPHGHAAALPSPRVQCHATRGFLRSSAHLPSLRRLWFYIREKIKIFRKDGEGFFYKGV